MPAAEEGKMGRGGVEGRGGEGVEGWWVGWEGGGTSRVRERKRALAFNTFTM